MPNCRDSDRGGDASIGEQVQALAERIRNAPEPGPHADGVLRLQRRTAVADLEQQLGRRYARCTLEGFQLDPEGSEFRPKQQAALSKLLDFSEHLAEHVQAGTGLLLHGPKGTGKDHFLAALLLQAVREGIDVRWVNGLDVFGAFRDGIADDVAEWALIAALVKPTILGMSDPVPPKGAELTAFQQSTLLRIVDARYRRQKPTWVTANITGREDGEKRICGPVVDRLIDGAVVVPCNWPSRRGPVKYV